MPLSGSVVAVAGAASGIGQGVALALAEKGAKLSLADVNDTELTALHRTLHESGREAICVHTDVRSTDSVNVWIEKTLEYYGQLDGAVNSAGVFRKGPEAATVATKSDEEWDYVTDINLKGMFRCNRAQLANMSSGASIVNISSVMGLLGLPEDAPYCVSKHGIIGLTRTAAKEMASRGIRVNCIAPAAIDTPMLSSNTGKTEEQLKKEVAGHTPMNRLGTTVEVAQTVVFLLSDQSSFTTGAVYTVDGGMTC